jgi:dTDP-4-amino-4,6-dideoxygalactose transaminase
VTNNDELALRCQLIRNHGENAVKEYGVEDISNTIGSNYRFTELQAAIAREQFKRLGGFLEHRLELAEFLNSRLSPLNGLTAQSIEKGSTHAYYMYPIRFDSETIGISRNLFLRAVSAEFPKPKFWDTTPLAEGYVQPLYLADLYQQQIAIGKSGFPFNVNSDVKYNYGKGICPVVETMYEKELLITPLVREGISLEDLADFTNGIEKVLENASDLVSNAADLEEGGIYDPINAIDSNV